MFSKTKAKTDTAAPAVAVSVKKGVPSVISGDLHILGSLISSGVIDVDGNIEGNVKGEQVTIRSNGKIKGDVIAQNVHVYGEVCGMIRAQNVALYSSCHVEGIVMHQSLTVEDGAFVDGKFKHLKDQAALDSAQSGDGNDGDDGILEMAPTSANNLRLIG